ncbi:hypothetical protein LPB142_06375 [Rhodobacter xanthinilyticus]|uniref:Uncharacterized protein n=1 Tax=Rhodobacter xanthinilyticus TaxID=1850250 RepID=A0A1D9MB20_9RHOB|nr:hypothetical protein LPB142_06375 [Rhodobacter xanthinilyticus]
MDLFEGRHVAHRVTPAGVISQSVQFFPILSGVYLAQFICALRDAACEREAKRVAQLGVLGGETRQKMLNHGGLGFMRDVLHVSVTLAAAKVMQGAQHGLEGVPYPARLLMFGKSPRGVARLMQLIRAWILCSALGLRRKTASSSVRRRA